MTKKHYEQIAEILREARTTDDGGEATRSVIGARLADMFKEDNSRFDYGRFMKAAELTD